MGPILGVGLSIAINDIDTLKKSLVNLGTMIALSLLTAYLFFFLFPLSEDNSELLGRVNRILEMFYSIFWRICFNYG